MGGSSNILKDAMCTTMTGVSKAAFRCEALRLAEDNTDKMRIYRISRSLAT